MSKNKSNQRKMRRKAENSKNEEEIQAHLDHQVDRAKDVVRERRVKKRTSAFMKWPQFLATKHFPGNKG